MESLSMQLQPLFEWLLRATLQASLLICLILLFQAVLRSRLGARWHYCLWLLLLIRMAMPWAPQSRLSMFNLIPQSLPQLQTEYARQEVGDDSADSDVADKSTAESTPISTTGIPQDSPEAITTVPEIHKEAKGRLKPVVSEIADILPLIWLTGALILAVYVCANNFNLLRIVKRERPLTDQKILDLLEDCKAEMGIRIILGVVTTDKVKSPALFGFIRPRLLLPKGMLEILSREELRYVFLHELAHLKRHDIYIGWLMSLLQVLHWFNPLIWLAFYRLRADRELACDALVLARTQSGQAKDYGRTIVSLLERFSRSQPLPAMAGILETKAQLKRRIIMIARFKNKSYQWSPLAVILIIILACVSLPDARRTKASETAAGESARQPNFRKIRIPTKPGNGVLSPDGKKLAFVSKRCIWVVPVHGKVSPDIAGEPVRLPGTEGAWRWGMSWSADGKWIAYNNLKNDEICIVPSSGGKIKRISVKKRDGMWNYRLSLSPDGKIVAFAAKEKEKIQLFTVNVDGGDVNQLTEDGGTEPAFSPDGKKIIYVKEKPHKTETRHSVRHNDVWVIPAVGGTPVQVSDLPGRAIGPIWSPDGKMIAFTRNAGDDDSKEICIVPVSETGKPEAPPTQIELPLATWNFLAGWTPDNNIGVVLTEPRHQAIYTVPTSGGNATQVTPQGNTFHPRWSPDGERIYFRWNGGDIASVPSGGGEISICPLDADSKICDYEALPGGGNAVSPDGKKIVFSGAKRVFRDNKRGWEVDIYTIPTEGGEPKKLTVSPGQDRFPCWSPDGKSIAFIRYAPMNICIVPTEGGEVRQLTSGSDRVLWSTIAWSPDGKSIAYFSEDKAIKVIPVQGGQPSVVVKVEDVSSHSELAWSPDGTKLVYSSKGSIWAVLLDGGEPEEIKTGLDAKACHVSWSPDGKKIAFTASKGGDAELWLMENFLPGAPVVKPEPTPTLRQIEVKRRGSPHSSPSFNGKYMLVLDRDRETGTDNLVIRELATGKERMLIKNTDPNWFVYESHISPDSKKVAFLHFNPEVEDFDLRVIGFDGSGLKTLLTAEEIAGYFFIDAWSPDGKYIFGRLARGPRQLVRVSSDDGSMEVIKTFDQGRASQIDVSPDGRYIAYSYAKQDTSNPDIFIFDLEQNQEALLVRHSAGDKLLGWTPDGGHIFFTSDRNGTWDGWLQRVVDGKPVGLPEIIKAGIGDVGPIGFTQSGSFYYAFNHEAWNIYTAKLDKNTGRVLSKPAPLRLVGKDVQPDWSPDGRYLAYLSQPNRNKQQIIRLRTLATGEEREIKLDLPRFERLRWCPDSRHLLITFFRGIDSPSIVYKVDIQSGEYTALVKKEERNLRQAELSTDGRTLVYRIGGLGQASRLITRDMETGNEKDLLHIEDASLAIWALSPDGKEVAFSIREGGVRAYVLKIISVETGESRTLVEDIGFFPIWSGDGRDILFTRKGNELWRVSAEGGEPQKLLEWHEIIWCPSIHPDGQRIAFHSGGYVSEMWVMENFLPTGVSQAK